MKQIELTRDPQSQVTRFLASSTRMADPNKAFMSLLQAVSRSRRLFDVFDDFVHLSAISLHNASCRNETLEKEYMAIVKRYTPTEVDAFPEMLSLLVKMLEPEPKDVLGPLFMGLDFGNKYRGQFFTPNSVCQLLAKMQYSPDLYANQPFVCASDPCAGAGAMPLALVNECIAQGLNPAEKLYLQCIDIDRTCALMCYIQLALWNVPATVIVGDTLRWELRESWFTPAYRWFGWDVKLANREAALQERR